MCEVAISLQQLPLKGRLVSREDVPGPGFPRTIREMRREQVHDSDGEEKGGKRRKRERKRRDGVIIYKPTYIYLLIISLMGK